MYKGPKGQVFWGGVLMFGREWKPFWTVVINKIEPIEMLRTSAGIDN